MTYRISLLLVVIFIFFPLAGCSGLPGPADAEADQICSGLIGSYETAGPRPLENAPPNEPFSAWLLAFVEDGTVLWRYSPEVSAGTYTCLDNRISATFPEGPRSSFEGVFDPNSGAVTIEELVYYKVTDE